MHYPRKRFGQNFLQDPKVIDRIITAINPQKTDHLVEIGPGLGALTFELLSQVKKMEAIEIDRDLIVKLQKIGSNLIIHQADALKFNFAKLGKSLRIVGNLPYNISTPLIFHLLKYLDYIIDMHFMLQKEVVERLAAPVGVKAYGRLSVMVQYFCKIEQLFLVKPEAFYPVPKIYSAIVRLIPRKKLDLTIQHPRHPALDAGSRSTRNVLLFKKRMDSPLSRGMTVNSYDVFADIVKDAFSQRRKTIKNALQKWISVEQLIKLHIDPKLRPEQLTVEDFVKISSSI